MIRMSSFTGFPFLFPLIVFICVYPFFFHTGAAFTTLWVELHWFQNKSTFRYDLNVFFYRVFIFISTNNLDRFAARCIKQKMIQKSSKIHPKIIQQSSKKARGPIGYPVLGASWGVLGRLGVSWRRLDASCGRPGSVLGRLGSVLGPKR